MTVHVFADFPRGCRPATAANSTWTAPEPCPIIGSVLLELVVENYAVVDRLRVRFHAGLNLLTGETGSGKSIVVDALGLLFGGRASAEMIRSGETARARRGHLRSARAGGRAQVLEPAGFSIEDGELLIEREILASGKSRAFLGSRPGGGVAAAGTGAAAGRYPRPARSAAAVFARRPARHAGRVRRKRCRALPAGGGL